MKVRLRDSDRDVVDAVFDLTPVSIVLPFDASGVVATLGRAGLVDAPDRIGGGMFAGDDRLTAITKLLFIPNDGFEKTLQSSWSHALLEGDRFGVFSLHAREQSSNIDEQQSTTFGASEAVMKTGEKLTEQFAQLCDILDQHGAAFRGFDVKQIAHGGSLLFDSQVKRDNSRYSHNLRNLKAAKWRCPAKHVS